ncbi:hypothetical protein ACROYT_G028982, partial [Oculina patagonica]
NKLRNCKTKHYREKRSVENIFVIWKQDNTFGQNRVEVNSIVVDLSKVRKMAAVFFKYTTDKAKFSSKDHSSNYQRRSIEAFLTGNGWLSVGNQVFHSDPSFGTAKEQMLSQAKALRDIEELIKWKPSLRESFKDSLIIVGQVYDIDSLLNPSEVCNHIKRTTKRQNGRQSLQLDLKSPRECSVKKKPPPNDGSDNVNASSGKPTKLSQPSTKTPERPNLKKTSRPARNRPMGSASKVTSRPIVNYPKTPVKTAKNTTATSMLTSGRCSSDINSNLLSGLEYGPEFFSDEDEM